MAYACFSLWKWPGWGFVIVGFFWTIMERNCWFLLNDDENTSLVLISHSFYAQLNDLSLLSGGLWQLQVQGVFPALPSYWFFSCMLQTVERRNFIELKNSCLPLLITVAISICNCCKGLRKGRCCGFFCLVFKCFAVHSVCFERDTVIFQYWHSRVSLSHCFRCFRYK